MVDLKEAFERVAHLDRFPFEDQQPNIEAVSLSVLYDGFIDYNFADRAAFDTKFSDETASLANLREVLKQGDQWINMLYTYRSCSKALPQVKTSDQPNKNAIYEGTYDVLEPEIKKLKTFMYFQRDTIKLFCEHVKKLAAQFDKKKNKEEFVPSESYVWCLIQLLDKFALLDALKNMKACLNNDFSFYKRAFGFLRKNMTGNDDQTQENHTLYLFLAHQHKITTDLKTEIQNIQGFEEVLTDLVNKCADLLEQGRYLLPNDKHTLLRVMSYGLVLMDGDANTPYNIFKNKKIKLTRFSSIFRHYPIVPLYGDMYIALESSIRRSPHFDEHVWGKSGTDPKVIAEEYEVLHNIEKWRADHNNYMARFGLMINKIRVTQSEKKVDFPKEIAQTILQGFNLLSDWTSKVLQQSAYKYANPDTKTQTVSTEYERVVRFNYSDEEKFALVEAIAMIKGLASVILKHDGLLFPFIRTYVHDETQEFIQNGLREIIRAATKKKKLKNIRDDLLKLRSLTADWFGGSEPQDAALSGKKSSKKDNDTIKIPSRAVGPTPTQLELLRLTAFALFSNPKYYKELESTHLKICRDFYNVSYFFPFLMDFGPTLLFLSDLGDLWYREFYLELSKRLQFPIDMSLPWILTDHILESKDPAMMEFVFYPLDLYNDSANRALTSLKQQFLYDEIEAEVNLCFDQLVYKLSETIYSSFKVQAASILIDKPYRSQMETIYSAHRLNAPKSRYDVLLSQRHIQLLGRSVDLNNLICQRMNTYLRQNVDYAISRFEASNITNVIELEILLNNIRFTHKLLSKYFELDPWESILNEINESTSIVSFHGRIVLHIIFELIYDFAPSWNYNSITNRFVPTPLALADEVPRESMPRPNPNFLFGSKVLNVAYSSSANLYTNFVGIPHIESILRLVGRSNLPLVISECLQNMDLKIRSVLAPYVKELMGGMPPSSKLPIHDYGTEGGYGYFQLKLKDIITYPDLRSEVLQNFRELGNIVVFMKLVDLALSQEDDSAFIVGAPFLGISPDSLNEQEKDPSHSSPLYVATNGLANTLESLPGTAKAPGILRELVTNAWKADKFYRPPTQNVSLFKSVLQRISTMLDSVRMLWSGTNPDNGVMNVDYTTEFYRLWSALQFVCCLPTGENELSNHEHFGDGLLWAGCTIIHFLGQRKRFEAFDFSYHILNVEETATAPCNQPHIRNYFKKVSQFRDINQTIFNLLSAYFSPPPPSPLILHPPEKDIGEEFIDSRSASKGTVPLRKLGPTSTISQNLDSNPAPPPPPDGNEPPYRKESEAPPPPDMDEGLPPPPPDMDEGLPPPPPPRD